MINVFSNDLSFIETQQGSSVHYIVTLVVLVANRGVVDKLVERVYVASTRASIVVCVISRLEHDTLLNPTRLCITSESNNVPFSVFV